MKRNSTRSKLIGLAFGYSKQQVGWNKTDEKTLQSLIPDPNKLLAHINKKRKK